MRSCLRPRFRRFSALRSPTTLYASSYQVQWINFSSWLIVGGLVFGGAALVCALVDLFRRAGGRGDRF